MMTGSASTVIHVCDERKIDDGFRTLLLQYLMAENFHHEKKRFFIVNNLREPKSSKFEEKLILETQRAYFAGLFNCR